MPYTEYQGFISNKPMLTWMARQETKVYSYLLSWMAKQETKVFLSTLSHFCIYAFMIESPWITLLLHILLIEIYVQFVLKLCYLLAE